MRCHLVWPTHVVFGSKLEFHLTTGKTDTPRGKYAFGFQDNIINGTRCFGHGGGAPGMNGELKICPGPGNLNYPIFPKHGPPRIVTTLGLLSIPGMLLWIIVAVRPCDKLQPLNRIE